MPSFRLLVQLLLIRPLLRFVFGVSVDGKENLAGLDRFILVANHNSHMDTLLLYSALPLRQVLKTDPVAAFDYFSKPRWLFVAIDYLFHPVWVDRLHKAADPVQEMLARIDSGRNIIIFPEGTRGEPGQLREFKTGVGRVIETRPEIPVVPVFLLGPERVLPRRATFPLPLWNHVTVGLPQRLEGECHDVTQTIKQCIEDLARSALARRQKREPDRVHAFTVAVLGIDGSGKSTLSKRLATELSQSATVCLISDSLALYENRRPKSMQPLLLEKVRQLVGRQAKRAKSLARYKIPKLTEMLLRDRMLAEANRWYRPNVVTMDGCPLLNMTAWAALYREEFFTEDFCAKAIAAMSTGGEGIGKDDPLFERFPEITYLKHFKLNRLCLPDVVLFLDVDPKEAMRRIGARGEQRQVHETQEKLEKLRAAYLLVCRVVERNPRVHACRLDGHLNLDQMTSAALDFIAEARTVQHEP